MLVDPRAQFQTLFATPPRQVDHRSKKYPTVKQSCALAGLRPPDFLTKGPTLPHPRDLDVVFHAGKPSFAPQMVRGDTGSTRSSKSRRSLFGATSARSLVSGLKPVNLAAMLGPLGNAL